MCPQWLRFVPLWTQGKQDTGIRFSGQPTCVDWVSGQGKLELIKFSNGISMVSKESSGVFKVRENPNDTIVVMTPHRPDDG